MSMFEKIRQIFHFGPRRLDTTERIALSLSFLLHILLIVAILSEASAGDWFAVFATSLALFFTLLPSILARNFRIHLPGEIELIIVAFVFATIFLGSAWKYYVKFWWWDLFLHTLSGIILGLCGFTLLYILAKERKIIASPILATLFSFTFAVALGAVWEIVEFFIDGSFGVMMQDSLADTMWDLIVDSIGALFASAIGFLYMKFGQEGYSMRLIKKFLKRNRFWAYRRKVRKKIREILEVHPVL